MKNKSVRLDLTLQNICVSERFQAKNILLYTTEPGLLFQGTCVESLK